MATPTRVVVTVLDNVDQNKSTFSFFISSTINTLAGIQGAAQAVIEEAQTLMTGTVSKVQATIGLDISGYTLVEAPGGDTDRLIAGRIAISAVSNPNSKAVISLPTFDIVTYVPVPGNDVDQAQADVAAFIADLFASGSVSNSSDIDMDFVDSFKETHGGKSR